MSQVITIDNYESISGVKTGDKIEFKLPSGKVLKYVVYIRYIGCGGYNGQIFEELGLDKLAFCDKAYGYRAKDGMCPECENNDYDALLRLIKALFHEIEKQSGKLVKKNVPQITTKTELKPVKPKTFKIVL